MPDLPLPKPQPPSSSIPPAVSPTGTVVAPQAVVPNKPPAVVTALSSVSSNKLPPPQIANEDSVAVPSPQATNTSAYPTSTPTITPPPTLNDAKKLGITGVVPARGTALSSSSDTSSGQSPTPSPNSTPPTQPAVSSLLAPSSAQPSVTSPSAVDSKPALTVSSTPTPNLQPTPLPISTSPAQFSAPPQPSPQILPPNSSQTPQPHQQPSPASSPISTPPPTPPPAPIPPPAPTAPTISPPLAKPKKSPLKLIVGIFAAVIGLLVVAAIVMMVINRPGRTSVDSGTTKPDQPSGQTESSNPTPPPADQTTIEYWGLWETSETLNSVFQDFQTQNPGLTVRYVQQSHRDFRERLQNAIVSGSGPDVFRFHASWVPMLSNELEPMPASVMSTSDFSQTFYPVASRQLQLNGQLVGIPLMYEGLVLYYNQDVLETAGVSPPQSWSALRDAARTLSIKQANGQLQRGGVAIGTAENVDHFADILAVLMLQNGANLEQPNSPEGRDALLFYTNFVKQDQVWSADLPSSTVAFARGDVAMMFAPSWRAFEITQINPNLRFAAVTLPQLPNNKIAWASYWAEGVSKQSQNKDAAWKLLQYLSQKEVQQKLFSAQSQTRAFGEPFSRVDLADQAATQPIAGPLLQDAPAAQGWYMSTFTHDNGINDQIIQYYKDAVNSLLDSGDIEQVLVTLQDGVNQVLSTYGVVAPLEPTPTIAQY